MLEINLRKVNNVAILDLSGSIDINAAGLIESVGWCLENGYRDILCNFENVNLLDYTGLSVIAVAHRDAYNHKARIKLVNVSAHVKKMFGLVCLDRVFEIYEDEDFALRTFKEDRVIAEIQKKPLRRRFKRLPLDMQVEFKAKHESSYLSGKVLNLSAVGVLIFCQHSYPLGEIVELKLTLNPQPGELKVEGKVVWLVEKELQPQIYPAMGLEFYNLSARAQKNIIDFVERNLPLNCAFEDQT